ncbi:response regulator transcription factor [Leisingera sp. ANG59]|uniref:response regulator n=1 Tax=Leisingera sp. ANG59 TaxID=2675221 RepID=UPI00157192D7|nr:response regulator transcription factor [Leisingera sp. ANG59]NSY41587.1 response regulator [Leisingera sp. ANG59]
MRILLAEDDKKTSDYVSKGLQESGYHVDIFDDGRDAVNFCLYNECDVVILDRMMPGMDGLSVLKAMRGAGLETPVIFLTAMGDVDDRVVGLSAGGDDYLVKPFHFSELLARVQAISRRKGVAETTKLLLHDLELDLLSRTAKRQGQTIELQTKEFSLLEVFMSNPGRVITKTMLLERVWDYTFDPNSTVVETHVSRLRAKIDKPFDTPLLHTIRNTGYSMHGPR